MGLHTSELVFEERGRGGECVPGVFDRLVTGYGALWVVGKKCYCEPGALRNYI